MPGSTDFYQWNPGENNQLTTSLYLSNSQRAGGALTDDIFSSVVANKLFYQVSIFASAFAQMMANKGYVMSDADFGNLVTALTNVKTSADFEASLITVAYTASVTFDAAQSSGFDLTLTGNVTASTLINTSVGQIITFIVLQDGTGGHTMVWPTNLTNPQPVCPVPNSFSIQQFIVRAPGGGIVPLGPMLWISSTGLLINPPGGVNHVIASGTIPVEYAQYTELVNASGGPITRTLPSAVGLAGFTVNVKKIDTSTNSVTVATQGGQTIDGFPNYSWSKAFTSLTFLSDGANWFLV